MAHESAVEGGYDYDFVDSPPDRLVCKICQSPCHQAQLTECCGHVFCKCCLNKFRSSTVLIDVSQACPMCREESFNAFAQREADREIKALKVYCPNKKDGCGWTGELASIVGHDKVPQKCKRCDKCIHYSDIHLPTDCPCYCPHCDITADSEVINSEHKEKCHKFPVTCPNYCGLDNIPRDTMDDHKKVCPLEVIQCEYHCGARISHDEMEKHNQEKVTEHIKFTRKVLSELEAKQVGHTISGILASHVKSHLIAVLVVIIAIQSALLFQLYYM